MQKCHLPICAVTEFQTAREMLAYWTDISERCRHTARVKSVETSHKLVNSWTFWCIMSFASLKSQRQSKASRSYVASSDNSKESHSTTVPKLIHSNNSNPSTSSKEGTVYHGIPENVEVRVSDISGRGLCAKNLIKAG
jgi:hypothetical protein